MSNAVTPLTAVIVSTDLISNINIKSSKTSDSLSNTIEANSNIHEPQKANSVGLSSSPSTLSSSPTSSTSSSIKADQSPNQMSNHLQQHQVHPVQLTGIQYFQYPSNNSTTPVNVSPLSSMTSSPSTTNTPNTAHSTTSIHYPTQQHFYHQHQPIAYTPTQHIHAFNPNFKDTRWLTLEVCREYQRNKCNRTDTDCKFAHPPSHVEIVNGKVIACYDSLKGKCTRKEPPCKYLHPPQHLKDQLLQNGKNNLVLRQVALAMMQQQHNQQPTNPAANPTLIAANPQLAQYATFANQQAANQAAVHSNSNLIQTLSNSGLTYSPVPLNHNGQLLPMITTNGFAGNQPINLSQQTAFLAADPTGLFNQVTATTTLSPGAAAATANGLLAPQQRTDRLLTASDINDAQSAAAAQYAYENGQAFQLSQYQIYPMYQRVPNTTLVTNKSGTEENANETNKTASASATAANANQFDVVPGKKRTHDAIEQDFIPVQNGTSNSTSQSGVQVKRTALADTKTGLPVFHSYNSFQHPFHPHLHPQHIALTQQPVQALNYQTAINIPMQFPPYISLPYTGHPSGMPRL